MLSFSCIASHTHSHFPIAASDKWSRSLQLVSLYARHHPSLSARLHRVGQILLQDFDHMYEPRVFNQIFPFCTATDQSGSSYHVLQCSVTHRRAVESEEALKASLLPVGLG